VFRKEKHRYQGQPLVTFLRCLPNALESPSIFMGGDGEIINLDVVNTGRDPNRGCGWKFSWFVFIYN
jgi:hypothetical protein